MSHRSNPWISVSETTLGAAPGMPVTTRIITLVCIGDPDLNLHLNHWHPGRGHILKQYWNGWMGAGMTKETHNEEFGLVAPFVATKLVNDLKITTSILLTFGLFGMPSELQGWGTYHL